MAIWIFLKKSENNLAIYQNFKFVFILWVTSSAIRIHASWLRIANQAHSLWQLCLFFLFLFLAALFIIMKPGKHIQQSSWGMAKYSCHVAVNDITACADMEKMFKKTQVKGESCSTQQLPAMAWGPNPSCWRFGKNILLEDKQTRSLMNCCDWLLATMEREFNSWDRDHMTCKVKNIYCLTLYQKLLPIFALSCDPLCVFVLFCFVFFTK